MTESLAAMLRRTAEEAGDARIDLDGVVADARKRQRRRQVAGVAGAVALVGVIVVGAFGVWGRESTDSEPPVSPSPSPTVVDPTPDSARPLVYAVGSTVHAGDRTIEANAKVMFVDATDDGVVFVTERDGRMWFDDGSTSKSIGLLAAHHVGSYEVVASNPGSLLVWPRGTGHGAIDSADEWVVYDTSARQELVRLPFEGTFSTVLSVDAGYVFFNPDSRTPGCWEEDVKPCPDPHVLRYDVASGETRKITEAEYEAELGAQARMLVGVEQSNDTSTVFTATGAEFRQQLRRLIPVGPNGGGDTVLTTYDGATLRLRLPTGYAAARDNISIVQWLDDSRVVIQVDQDRDEVGYGDEYRAGNVDLLVCKVPDGVCRVATRSSASVPYLAPGP